MRVYSSVFLQNPKRVVAAHSLGGQPETQVDSGDATIHLADHHSPSQNNMLVDGDHQPPFVQKNQQFKQFKPAIDDDH